MINQARSFTPVARETRKDQIFDVVSQYRSATIRHIANRLGMAKSAHLTRIIDEMVNEGVLVERWDTTWNKLPVRVFSIAPELAE